MALANSPDHQLTNSRFRHSGWIEVVTGSMFSGKSEELIRRLRRAQIAKQKVQIFKPLIDNRFSEDHIVSHSDMRIASQNVRNSDELIRCVDKDTEVVGIDLTAGAARAPSVVEHQLHRARERLVGPVVEIGASVGN